MAGTNGNGGGPKCYSCGKQGHKAAQCPSKQGNDDGQNQGKGKFTGKYNHCGKVGHLKADCWDLPENAEKRPKNYGVVGGNNNQSSEIGTVSIEALLGAVDLGDVPKGE